MSGYTEEDAVSQGTLKTASGQVLPLESTRVDVQVNADIATTTVTQRFHNTCPDPVEAIYAFPLPAGASVFKLEFRIADRVVRAVVRDRLEARQRYEEAMAQGRAATLLEQDTPEIFTLSVANIAPNVRIDVEMVYQQLLEFDDGQWRLIFPMVAPTQYLEGPAPAPGQELRPPRQPSSQRDNAVTLSVSLDERAAQSARCLSHPITADPCPKGLPGRTRLQLDTSKPVANRDFVLVWQASSAGIKPQVCFERPKGGKGTFLLTVVPSLKTAEPAPDAGTMQAIKCGNCGAPISDMSSFKEIPGLGLVAPCGYCGALLTPGTEVTTQARQPRDVLILIDRSASMRGAEQDVRNALGAILAGLPQSDAVQVVAFDHQQHTMGDTAPGHFTAVCPELARQADAFIAQHPPRGGSELQRALERSASAPLRPGRTRAVVLISDMAVGNAGRLLRRAPKLLGPQARLFVLGVGAGVNRRLVRRLAQAGQGAFDVLDDTAHTSQTLERFVRRVAACGPVLTGISLWWEGADATEILPQTLPDLYDGQALRVLGRFAGQGPSRLVLTAQTADGKPFRQELRVTLPTQTPQDIGLARLWATGRIQQLLDKAPRDSHAESLALALALEYAIVSPLTSMIAEDVKVSVKPTEHQTLTLMVLSGAATGKRFEVDKPRVVIGRHNSCDLVIGDGGISRMHAEVVLRQGQWWLRDLDSVNGVYIGPDKIREVPIKPGQTFTLSNATIRVEGGEGEVFRTIDTRRARIPTNAPASAAPDAAISVVRSVRAKPPHAPAASVPPPLGGRPPAPMGAAPAPIRAAPAPMAPPMGAAPIPTARPMSMSAPKPPGPPSAPPRPAPALMSALAPPAPSAPPAMGAPPPSAPAPAPGGRPPAAPAPARPAPAAPITGSFMAPPSPAPPRAAAPPAVGPGGGRPESGGSWGGFGGGGQRFNGPPPQAPINVPGAEPYPERELRWLGTRGCGQLDLVFLVDATGSMGAYIEQVRMRLLELVEVLKASPLCQSLHLGLVAYRDHPPQDHTWVTQRTDLTGDISSVERAVQALRADGGGDGPEAVTAGLFDVVRLDWRPGAARAVVWFGDAPPHGVEPSGDGFPQGCPTGHHWFTQAESCREMGISIYAIGCLPGLRSFQGAEQVFRQVARTTHGMFLPLSSAELLLPLIAGAAASELDRQRIDAHVEDMCQRWHQTLATTDDHERQRWLTQALRRAGVRPRQMLVASDSGQPQPLRFSQISTQDVAGSLGRLRAAGKLPF